MEKKMNKILKKNIEEDEGANVPTTATVHTYCNLTSPVNSERLIHAGSP